MRKLPGKGVRGRGEYYDDANPCPLGVETADGSPLRIIARGDLNQYLRGVYVCEDVEGTLVSLQELQNVICTLEQSHVDP